MLEHDAKVVQPLECLFRICSSTTFVIQSLPDSVKCFDGLDEVAGLEAQAWRHQGGRTKRIKEALRSRRGTARGKENIIPKATAGSQPGRLCI